MDWKNALLEPDFSSTALWQRCGKPTLAKALAFAVTAVVVVDFVLITFGTLVAAATH